MNWRDMPTIVCHEHKGGLHGTITIKSDIVRNYIRDGGRPSEAALQEEASNHFKLRW